MADSKGGNGTYLDEVLVFLVVLFIVGLGLANLGFIGDNQESELEQNLQNTQIENRPFKINNLFPTGDIKLGQDIINKQDILVHRNPRGPVLGEQLKREVGKIIEGPVIEQNQRWWRVDYKEAPDGWVRGINLTSHVWQYRLVNIFPIVFGSIAPFMILISIILIILIIIVSVKNRKLEALKQKKLDHARGKNTIEDIKETSEKEKQEDEEEPDPFIASLPTDENIPKSKDVHNKRWAKVESLINSHNVNDWKQAIIESDIILDEMLEKMGYKGDTIADKLKQVEQSDFLTLNQAWEAHKVRNKIAHKADYVLSKSDADRTISLFRQVFEEFYFI